jgi:hypothetical protein
MPMTGSGMAGAIDSAIASIPGINITEPAELQNFCNALGDAIVAYIQANATVTVVTTTPGAQAGITTLPGTGTGTVS